MSKDKSTEPADSQARRPIADPRRTGGQPPRSPMTTASLIAGWTGVAVLLVAVVWWVVTKSFSTGPIVVLVAGAILGAFWMVVNFATLRQCLSGRRAGLIVNSTVFALLVLSILVLVNYVGVRHHIRKDLTAAKRYSLSEQTHKVAKALDKDVELITFVSPNYFNAEEISDRLREYEMLSPRIKLHKYDPQMDFDKVKEYEVQMDGTVIVKSGERTEKVTGASEEQLTSAILAVTTGEKTKVYFLSGHGERPLQGGGADGLGTVKRSLENQQYQVEALSLVTMEKPKVPDDCAVLVIAGPQQPLHKKELAALHSYISRAGKLFIAVDPPPAPGLTTILIDYGVMPLDGVVMDPQQGYWGQLQVPVVVEPAAHEITRNIEAIALPDTRAFELDTEPPEPEYPGAPRLPQPQPQPLLASSSASWLETTPQGTVQQDPDERSGPLVMAVVIDESSPPPSPQMGMPPSPPPGSPATRMVVVGSSIMMTDRLIQAGLVGGANMVLKSIAWLVENEKLVSIPPKQLAPNYVSLSDPQRKLAIVFVMGVIPLLIMISGGIVWWIRRRG